MYKLVRDGLTALEAQHTHGIDKLSIRQVINEGNISSAEKILEDFVIPLMENDSRELLISCLNLPHTDIYEGWNM